MTTEKLITADIVEILDIKIKMTNDHSGISIVAGDTLAKALLHIAAQEPSSIQKDALLALLTQPSATNPVVLKDDIQVYYPLPDVGELKDSVPTVPDLPSTGNTVGDLRAVLATNNVYLWDGSTWIILIKAGTLDHTMMTAQDGDPNYQHITVIEKVTVISQIHTHPNKPVLDQIITAGSGAVITADERSRLPTADEKAALAGTIGTPSSTNRYVTAVDPRLNTVRNPYITVGPNNTGATYTGMDKSPFELAFTEVDSGVIKSIEILPGTFEFAFLGDFTPLVWNSSSGITLEALAVGNSRIILETFSPGIQFQQSATPADDKPVSIKGISFDLRSSGTEGVQINRARTLIEDCTFTSAPGASLSDLLVGLRIEADECVVRRCKFTGLLSTGLQISSTATNIRIEDCEFSLSAPSSIALHLEASNATVSNNTFNVGTTQIESTSAYSSFEENRYASDLTMVPFIDAGSATRWLTNFPPAHGQPYLGVSRSIGPIGSFADFTGADEAAFNQAVADPRVKILEILPGTYSFASIVTIPVSGIKLRSVSNNPSDVVVIGAPGVTCFSLNTDCSLEGISVSAFGVPAVTIEAGSLRTSIKRCELTETSPGVFAVAATGTSDLLLDGCMFLGSQGLWSDGVTQRLRVKDCIFSTSATPLSTSSATQKSKLDGCIFQGPVAMDLRGQNWTVVQNHFLSAQPTKVNTIGSVWSENWPSPQSNNNAGVDVIKMSMTRALAPIVGTGAEKTSFAGIGVIAFVEAASGVAVTLPTFIPDGSKLNRANGFNVELNWTAPVFSGIVQWQVEVIFRDALGLELGSPSASQIILSSRTKLTPRAEDKAVFIFTNADYSFIPGVDPTHVSIIVRRLGDELAPQLDTLPGNAYLTALTLTVPRD